MRQQPAGKVEDLPGHPVARAVQPAVLCQQCEDRGGRIPDADPPLGHEVAELLRVFAQAFADQHQRRRGLAGREEVKHRQVGVQTPEPIEPEGEGLALASPGGRAATATHVGAYQTIGETTRAIRRDPASSGIASRPKTRMQAGR